MMRKNRVLAITIVLAFGLLTVLSGLSLAGEPVKIGFVGAFTGPAFKMTKDAEQAAWQLKRSMLPEDFWGAR